MKKQIRLSALALLAMITLQACTAVAVGVAVRHIKGNNKDTATAEVGTDPEDIYQAQLDAFQARPDASIISTDPANYTIRGTIGDDQVLSTVRPAKRGKSELRVEALSTDPLGPDESPAMELEGQILDRLDLVYRIDEID
ncbi:MAG: hypothetical protein ACR2RV_07095 [Verrucomicrobiales bacterium]